MYLTTDLNVPSRPLERLFLSIEVLIPSRQKPPQVSKHREAHRESSTKKAVSKHRDLNPLQAKSSTKKASIEILISTRKAVSKHRDLNPLQEAVSKHRDLNPLQAKCSTKKAVSKLHKEGCF